jgi:predicted MFS family arabinose efflux permease
MADNRLRTKLADIWSRPHALTLAVVLYAVGYAMCAGAQNVETLVAGQVVYTLGNTGITFRRSRLSAVRTST